MKKILIYSILAIALISHFGFTPMAKIVADSKYVDMPKEIELSQEETTFELKLNEELKNNQRLKIIVSNKNKLVSEKNEEQKLEISLSNVYLTNNNPISKVTIKHDKLDYANWRSDLDIKFVLEETVKTNSNNSNNSNNEKQETSIKNNTNESNTKTDTSYKEEKTMYTYQTVTGWNEGSFSLEMPEGIYEQRTQYATSTASFDNSNFSLDIPGDGFYKTSTQYGYNQRSKKTVSVPYTATRNSFYNNVGACPADCISGTINDYGSGCECTIVESYTAYKNSFSYGSWETNNDSWRFDGAYGESDTVQPITRDVYLIPISWSEPSDWSYDNKSSTSETKVIERVVYVTPSSYSNESAYQDTKPSGSNIKINTYHFYRIVTNGIPGEWIKY